MHSFARVLFALGLAIAGVHAESARAPCTFTCPSSNAAGNELYIAHSEPSTGTLTCSYFTSDPSAPLDRCEYGIVDGELDEDGAPTCQATAERTCSCLFTCVDRLRTGASLSVATLDAEILSCDYDDGSRCLYAAADGSGIDVGLVCARHAADTCDGLKRRYKRQEPEKKIAIMERIEARVRGTGALGRREAWELPSSMQARIELGARKMLVREAT